MFLDRKIRLAFQKALLKKVTTNLRKIFVDMIDRNVYIYFYYDQEISSLDKKLADEVIMEMKKEYKYDEQGIETNYVYTFKQLSYPQVPPRTGECLYLRYEPTPPEFHDE